MMVLVSTWDPWSSSAHAPEDLEDEHAKVSDCIQSAFTYSLNSLPPALCGVVNTSRRGGKRPGE